MKAMIMAAGKGTRLGLITDSLPKVLVDINGKSVLQRAVEKCSLHGFDEIIINVHHFAGQVLLKQKDLNALAINLQFPMNRKGCSRREEVYTMPASSLTTSHSSFTMPISLPTSILTNS